MLSRKRVLIARRLVVLLIAYINFLFILITGVGSFLGCFSCRESFIFYFDVNIVYPVLDIAAPILRVLRDSQVVF